mgnify:CR=1 FL=1
MKKMKQVIFILLSGLLLFSCSLDGEEQQQLNLEIVLQCASEARITEFFKFLL